MDILINVYNRPEMIPWVAWWSHQVCDPIWNILFKWFCTPLWLVLNILVELSTVNPTCHALYMCCVNVHVSLYILCRPNWHAVGPSSCEAFSACTCVCMVCIALSKAPAYSRPPGHNGLQLPPSPPIQAAAKSCVRDSFLTHAPIFFLSHTDLY